STLLLSTTLVLSNGLIAHELIPYILDTPLQMLMLPLIVIFPLVYSKIESIVRYQIQDRHNLACQSRELHIQPQTETKYYRQTNPNEPNPLHNERSPPY